MHEVTREPYRERREKIVSLPIAQELCTHPEKYVHCQPWEIADIIFSEAGVEPSPSFYTDAHAQSLELFGRDLIEIMYRMLSGASSAQEHMLVRDRIHSISSLLCETSPNVFEGLDSFSKIVTTSLVYSIPGMEEMARGFSHELLYDLHLMGDWDVKKFIDQFSECSPIDQANILLCLPFVMRSAIDWGGDEEGSWLAKTRQVAEKMLSAIAQQRDLHPLVLAGKDRLSTMLATESFREGRISQEYTRPSSREVLEQDDRTLRENDPEGTTGFLEVAKGVVVRLSQYGTILELDLESERSFSGETEGSQEQKIQGSLVNKLAPFLQKYPMNERSVLTRLLLHAYHPDTARSLSEYTHVNFHSLSIREQIAFLSYVGRAPKEESRRVLSLTGKFGLPFMRTFLSAESGRTVTVQEVLALTTKCPENQMHIVWNRYSAFVETAQSSLQAWKGMLFSKPEERVHLDQWSAEATLLQKADQVLREVIDAPDTSLNTFHEKFDQANTDLEVFVTLFSRLIQRGHPIDWQEIRNMSLAIKKPSDLSQEERSQMLAIVRLNYASSPFLPYVVDAVASYTQDHEHTEWTLLKHESTVLGMLRVDTKPDGTQYLGSVNIRSVARGSGMGERLLQEAISRSSEKGIMELHADPQTAIASTYVEKLGFTIRGVDIIKTGDKEIPSLRMRHEKKIQRETREWSFEKCLALTLNESPALGPRVLIQETRDMEKLAHACQEGWIGTRYFFFPERNDQVLIVLERLGNT